MTLTGKNVIVGMILLGMVVAGLSNYISDTTQYYNITTNSTYQEAYTETTDIIQNMSLLSKTFQTNVQGEGGVLGTIIEGLVAIPKALWSLFMLIIITPISLSTTLLAHILGLAGLGESNTLWLSVGLEAIIIVCIVWVIIRARFRYNV